MFNPCNSQKKRPKFSVPPKPSPNSCLLFQRARGFPWHKSTHQAHLSGVQSKYRSQDAHSISQSGQALVLSNTPDLAPSHQLRAPLQNMSPHNPASVGPYQHPQQRAPRVSCSPRLIPFERHASVHVSAVPVLCSGRYLAECSIASQSMQTSGVHNVPIVVIFV